MRRRPSQGAAPVRPKPTRGGQIPQGVCTLHATACCASRAARRAGGLGRASIPPKPACCAANSRQRRKQSWRVNLALTAVQGAARCCGEAMLASCSPTPWNRASLQSVPSNCGARWRQPTKAPAARSMHGFSALLRAQKARRDHSTSVLLADRHPAPSAQHSHPTSTPLHNRRHATPIREPHVATTGSMLHRVVLTPLANTPPPSLIISRDAEHPTTPPPATFYSALRTTHHPPCGA